MVGRLACLIPASEFKTANDGSLFRTLSGLLFLKRLVVEGVGLDFILDLVSRYIASHVEVPM